MKNICFVLLLFLASRGWCKESVKRQLRDKDIDIIETTETRKPRNQVHTQEVRNPPRGSLGSKFNIHEGSARRFDGSTNQRIQQLENIKSFLNEGYAQFRSSKVTQNEGRQNSTGNLTVEFLESLNILRDEVKHYLNNTNMEVLREAARSIIAVDLPQGGLFGNLIGLRSNGLGSLAFLLFLGWPVLLGLLYVGLIVLFPNRRSDNAFEKHLSTMVETMSHMMHTAEDKFLDFLEEVTDPGDTYGSYSETAYVYADPYDRHDVIYQPTSYLDENGERYDSSEHYNGGDAWGYNSEEAPIFISPHEDSQSPVVSYNPATPSGGPLREQYEGGNLSNLADNPDIQNEIAKKDKYNFLNVVLGAQYQHTKPSGSLADQGVIQGTVAADVANRPAPPKGYRPQSSLRPTSSLGHNNFRFNADIDPRPKEDAENTSGFKPSKLENPETREFEDHWVAIPIPSSLNRNGNPSSNSNNERQRPRARFPKTRQFREEIKIITA